jgi:PTS system ascorbate-specific IIC component
VLGNLARYLSFAITGLVVALFVLLVAYNVFAKKNLRAAARRRTAERNHECE